MPQFRVFLGAPSRRVSRIPIHSYQWHTIESKLRGIQPPLVIFPPATLEAPSRQISLIHQDFIFKTQNDEELESSGDDDPRVRNLGSIRPTILHLTVLISNLLLDGTTVITWLLRQNAFSHLIPHLILTRQHKRRKRQFHINIRMRHPLVAFHPSRSTCIPSPRFLRSFLRVRKDHGKLTYLLQLSKWKAQIPSRSKGAMIEDDFRRRACECSQTYGLARDCRFVGWKC